MVNVVVTVFLCITRLNYSYCGKSMERLAVTLLQNTTVEVG